MEASISPHNSISSQSSASRAFKKFHQVSSNNTTNTPSESENEDPIDGEVVSAAYKLKLKKRDELLQRIQNVRTQRENIQRQNESISHLKTLWMHRHNQTVSKRALALSDYERQRSRLSELEADYEKVTKVNVLQDVFHIWHRGHGAYATINGLRIGMCDAPPVPPAGAESNSSSSFLPASSFSSSSSSTTQSQNQSASNSFWNNNTITNTASTATNSSTNNSKSSENDVPWHEINAAIGMVALLIHTLQSKLQIYQSKYMIQPRGSSTKVHSRKTKQEWDLCHQPSAFQFFARRNWNAALNILGYCLWEVVRDVSERMSVVNMLKKETEKQNNDGGAEIKKNKYNNMEWVMPFAVSLESDWENERIGSVKVGGLDFAFNGDGVEWTKAMRYMAIDLKVIVAFVAKCVDE